MANKGQKHIDKLLADFLPAASQAQPIKISSKQKRKPQAKQPTRKQKDLVQAYLDKSNPKTYGNGTQSALVAYDVSPDNRNLAGQIAFQQLKSNNVINYLEEYANKIGVGTEVRLDTLRSFIAGKGTQTTTIRHKTVDTHTGRLKLSKVQEIDAPPRIHDRITAIKELNSMTGFYKQQEIDKQVALAEVTSMYDRIVGKGTGKTGHRGERGVSV